MLVLSLFDGIGSLQAALLMLGAAFHALIWETDPDALEVCQRTCHPVRHFGDVLAFDCSEVEPFIQSRRYSAILVAGGSPCQDVSLLKRNRPGADSSRTQLFTAVPHVAQTCRSVLQECHMDLPVLQVLEIVRFASADFFDQAWAAMHGPPLTISAGSFGWTKRDRSWWCSDGHHSAHDLEDISLPSQLQATRSRWQHKHPWPRSVQFADGYKAAPDPAQVAKSPEQLDCFPVFSRCFKHKPDRGPQDDPEVMARFHADGGRFPLFNYTRKAMLWKKDAGRPPNSSERAAMMGFPATLQTEKRP